MIQKHKIRLNSTTSINSLNVDNQIGVKLQNTSKPYLFTNIKDEIDQYEVFLNERDNCTKFRLITTISPFCSNILFNPFTEIIKNVKKIERDNDDNEIEVVNDKIEVVGGDLRIEMIRNTGYSSEQGDENNYVYYPGYDILNNHTLRNKSFKVVNTLRTALNRNNKDTFNTISDYDRNYDGSEIKFSKRTLDDSRANISVGVSNGTKHLYTKEDIMDLDECANTRLIDENGWVGFVNQSAISVKKYEASKAWKDWVISDYNHTINNHENCDFIDMYPDRTLYSFNPKYNNILHRPEYNWDIHLTYPYKNFYNHELIKDKYEGDKYTRQEDGSFIKDEKGDYLFKKITDEYKGDRYSQNKDGSFIKDEKGDYLIKKLDVDVVNGLLFENVQFTLGINGENVLLFQTYCKHNLQGGDVINLYYQENKGEEYIKIENIIISDIGDLNKNNDEYCFYVTDISLFDNIPNFKQKYAIYDSDAGDDQITDKEQITNAWLKGKNIRFKQVINNVESEYYIRIFKKLPNILKADRDITENDKKNRETLETYFNKNCKKDFDKEIYQLGFASTIYNDKNTQVVFTDGIGIENILDNRGRPLHEIFLTIVKNNKGYSKWYGSSFDKDLKSITSSEVEFSHCFGRIMHGFEYFHGENSDIERHAMLSDIRVMHNCPQPEGASPINYGRWSTGNFGWLNYPNAEFAVKPEESVKDEPTVNDETEEPEENRPQSEYYIEDYIEDEFIGDIVEYNNTVCVEHVLSDGCFRFNTYLRENPTEGYAFFYDRFISDDYDSDEFTVRLDKNFAPNYNLHPEGYYYKAHYPIQLREFGDLEQASHFELKYASVKKVNIGNKLFCVIKTLLPHRLSTTDTVMICDDSKDKVIGLNPSYIIDDITFAIGEHKNLTTEDIYRLLNGNFDDSFTIKLRRYNDMIPFYADKTPGINRYMWRVLNNVGNKDNVTLQEYPFANDYFYINQKINFYLRRQDPFNELGLYYYGYEESLIPNDIVGNNLPDSVYEYKDETEVTC